MAKQMMHPGFACAPAWFGMLVFLVGVWFILENLKIITTGISIWPVIIALIGIKMWARSCKCK